MHDAHDRTESAAVRDKNTKPCPEIEDTSKWYYSLLQNNPDGIIEVDDTGLIIALNPSCEKITGFSTKELCGHHILDLSLHDPSWTDCVRLSLRGQVASGESPLSHKTGTTIYVQHKFIPVIIDDLVAGIHVVITDITEVRHTKAELLLAEQRLQTIFDTVNISLWSEDFPSRSMTYVSPGSERVWGIPFHELMADSSAPYNLIHPDDLDEIRERMQDVERGHHVIHTFRIIRNGEIRWIHDEVIPIMDKHGNLTRLTGLSIDITETKLAEEEAAKTREILQRSGQLSSLGQLAAGVAHEIRNPLTSVMGFMQLMKPLLPNQTNYINIIMSELNRISEIVGEFLMLAKPQQIRMETQDLRSIVTELISFLHSQAIMSNISFVLNVDPSIPGIHCDKSQVKQILINLIKNAMEAMPEGGTITISLTVQTENEVLIQIADQGCGIDSEIVAKIGEPFFTTKEGGTGLGMMVTRQLIENHGGNMVIESKIDQGTIISVTLPIVQ